MNASLQALASTDWLGLFTHFLSLSLLSVGGAIAMTPDMHRYLVDQNPWMTDAQFTSSVAIAQVAPGPNVLFVGLLGWNAGLNAAGWPGAALGMFLTLVGMMGPSSTLTYLAAQWGHRNRDLRWVRAFKMGMTPIVIALMMSTGWILSTGGRYELSHWPVWLLSVGAMILCWRTRIHLLWLLAAGALAGGFGLV